MSYTLYTGDCLEILPTLEAGLSASEVGIIAPFSANVARMTKANEVAQMIGLLGNLEICKADNVMNVKLSTIAILIYAALLASIVISFPGSAALTFPVSAVIVFVVSTAPPMMIFAAMPFISAIGRAETKTPCTLKGGGDYYVFSTLFAIKLRGWLCWERGQKSVFPSLGIALMRTDDDILSSHLKRLALEYLSANLANVGVMVPLCGGSKFIRTLAAA